MAEAVVSYPGAKWRFYPHMVKYFPLDMKTFIEPFFGGGSVSLSVADDPRFTKLERMIGGDLYTEMWAFWNGIKKDPAAVEQIAIEWFRQSCPTHDIAVENGATRELLVEYLENDDYLHSDILSDADKQTITEKKAIYKRAVEEAEAFWKWTQTVDCTQMSLEQRAARIILVNKISFSGMGDSGSLSKDQFFNFRENKLKRVYETSKILNDHDIQIYNVSFEETMKYGNEDPENSFIFLEPPYFAQEGSGLYGKNGSTHHGFPHQAFADLTKSMKCKWFVTYDDSVAVRQLFSGLTVFGKPCCLKPFTIPGGYTMAGKTAEDALAGEELFIANYDLDAETEIGTDDF